MLGSKVFVGLTVAAGISTNAIFFSQYPTVTDLPSDYFTNQKTIFGRVERVIDGDTIRATHCPTRFYCPRLDDSRGLYKQTMSIRIYGVDCPELQKRKSDPPSQPFAEEAKEFTSNLVQGQKVKIKLLRRDQYGRAVAKVEGKRRRLPPFSKRDVSMELLKKGLATIYTGGGAEYDGNLPEFREMEELAKRRRRGMWSQDNLLTPSEFKKQLKQATVTP